MGGFYNVDKTTGELIPVAGGTLYADLPIGSWVKNDMGTIPTGFLKEGDTISATEHPELYAEYGSTVPYKADKSELSDYETITISTSSSSPTVMTYDGYLTIFATGGPRTIYINGVRVANSSPTGDLDSATTVAVKKGDQVYFSNWYNNCCRGAFYKKSLIVKAKNVGVPADFSKSLIGYVGQETDYNLYPWSHVKSEDGVDINQDITIDRDGWYSIDYTLSNNADTTHTFTLRDFDSQGNVHTVMRAYYGKSGTFRQTFLVPLKAGTYRYSHGGIGTLSVYMNRRDFAY